MPSLATGTTTVEPYEPVLSAVTAGTGECAEVARTRRVGRGALEPQVVTRSATVATPLSGTPPEPVTSSTRLLVSPDQRGAPMRHGESTPVPVRVSSTRTGVTGTRSPPTTGEPGSGPQPDRQVSLTGEPLQNEVSAMAPSHVREMCTWLRWHSLSYAVPALLAA